MECLRITFPDGTCTYVNQTNVVSLTLSASTTTGGSVSPNAFLKKGLITGVTYNKIVGASITYVSLTNIQTYNPGVNNLYEYGEQTYDNTFSTFYSNIQNN